MVEGKRAKENQRPSRIEVKLSGVELRAHEAASVLKALVEHIVVRIVAMREFCWAKSQDSR